MHLPTLSNEVCSIKAAKTKLAINYAPLLAAFHGSWVSYTNCFLQEFSLLFVSKDVPLDMQEKLQLSQGVIYDLFFS